MLTGPINCNPNLCPVCGEPRGGCGCELATKASDTPIELTADVIMDIYKKLEILKPEIKIKAIIITRLAIAINRAAYEGEEYFLIHPSKWLELLSHFKKFESPTGLSNTLWGIPVFEDDELARKIILAALPDVDLPSMLGEG